MQVWPSPKPESSADSKQVEGPLNRGVVNLHMTRHPKEGDFEYKYLYLDVNGRDRIYLKNSDRTSSTNQKKSTKLFGIRWT